MITKQVIKTSIEELKEVSKTDFFVVDGQGLLMAATSKETPNTEAMIEFSTSPTSLVSVDMRTSGKGKSSAASD